MACNGLFGNGGASPIGPPDEGRHYTLRAAEIVIVNEPVRKFLRDLRLIIDMHKCLPRNQSVTERALFKANEAVNVIKLQDLDESVKKAQTICDNFLDRLGAPERFTVWATGHCHIDTAWLWRYRETRRKCARSWASQLRLLEKYPAYHFACPQLQQLDWLKKDYPELFSQIQVRAKEGRFIPIGGSWVEMDGNMPSGESFARQFLYGLKFMKENFDGLQTKVFWLPDSFGYNAQLPQLMKLAGIPYFLTQKISWNNVDKFPHNSFQWEGIDGTRVLAHFPPADTYNSDASVGDLRKSESNYRDADRSEQSLLLFGYGDGGGGPTDEMLYNLGRLENVHGLPKVNHDDPFKFFEKLNSESDTLEVWSGELYLEFHRGTLTSQAKTKYYNRRCESLLRETEIICTVLRIIYPSYEYPKDDIERLWKDVLLCQFHDVLPGSSIEAVYHDTSKIYQNVEFEVSKIREIALRHLFGVPNNHHNSSGSEEFGEVVLFNSTPFERSEVIILPWNPDPESPQPGVLAVSGVPSLSMTTLKDHRVSQVEEGVTVKMENNTFVLENRFLKILINSDGQIVSIYDKLNTREVIQAGQVANSFWLYDDRPNSWDAWDVEVFYGETGKCVDKVDCRVEIGMEGPVMASIVRRVKITEKSQMTQIISINCLSPQIDFFTSVDWAESHKLLRVLFPVSVKSDHGVYECPFGQVSRPTHSNTSWDEAKFEACGHRYVDLSEEGYGVALLNDSKYGHSIKGQTIGMSLLRAPKQPDATCDMSKHIIRYALLPHKGSIVDGNVIAAAYHFNNPLRWTAAPTSSYDPGWLGIPFVTVQPLILDGCKVAEDHGQGEVIVRLYEGHGSRGVAPLKLHPKLRLASPPVLVNLLEDPMELEDCLINDGTGWFIRFGPYQIISLKLRLTTQ